MLEYSVFVSVLVYLLLVHPGYLRFIYKSKITMRNRQIIVRDKDSSFTENTMLCCSNDNNALLI